MRDHVHMLLRIPPKYAVSNVVGYIMGKGAIRLARVYTDQKRNFTGRHFWGRGYCLDGGSVCGLGASTVRCWPVPAVCEPGKFAW